MFRSATLRLTLWYLAIVMAISLLFSVALYNVTTDELSRGLHSESQSLYTQFPVFQNDPNLKLEPGPFYASSSHRILLRLIAFNILVLIGAGITSYWLARRTLEPIENAHTQQKRFTSDVSHELRTPLTAIKMESEVALLNKKSLTSELRSTLQSNLEEVGKLEALINNLLKLSRLEVDELQQNFIPIKSNEVINIAVSQVDKLAKQRSINLVINDKTADQKVAGDQESLNQMLVILLDNAIKYSPEGSTINIEALSSKDNLLWQVSDNGIGIEPEALKHVFDRFYRADSSRNKLESSGYGLGLSIAKMIADIHNATITLSSRVNHGTIATISIPKLQS